MSSQQNLLSIFGAKLQPTQGLMDSTQTTKNSEVPEEKGAISRNYQNPSVLAIRYLRLKKVMKRRSVSIF